MATTTAETKNDAGTIGNTTAAAKDALNGGIGQVKALAKKQPFAFAALAGVLGIAALNTLRGK